MKISKMLILGVVTVIVGATLMAVGLGFSETVNPVSVLGIIFGSQALTMGQLLVVKSTWRSYQETKKLTPAAS